MLKKTLSIIVAGTVLFSSSLIAQPAQSEKQAKSAVEFRQALLQLVRSNVGALGAMAKGEIPMDTQTIETNAMRIEQLSLMMQDYFELDTREYTLDTSALPKIWQEFDAFSQKIDDLTMASQSLKEAAMAGKESEYKAGIGAVLKSCKGCHDSYKAD